MTLQTAVIGNEQCIMDCTICDPINQLQEQAKQSEEQAKKMGEQTEQLAGEVASLREALENLVIQMAAKWNYDDCILMLPFVSNWVLSVHHKMLH